MSQRVDEPLSRRALMRSTSIRDAEGMGAKFWSPHRLRLADSSRFNARINGLSLGGVSLFYMSYEAPLELAGDPLTDYVAILLPITGEVELRQGRTRFAAYAGQGASVVSQGVPFLQEWSPGLEMFCLKVDAAQLRNFAASVDVEVEDDVFFRREVTSPHTLEALLGCIRLVELAVGQLPTGQRMPPALASRMRDQILLTLLMTQPNSLSAKLSCTGRTIGRDAVRRAVDYIDMNPAAATTSDAAREAGLSIRALQENFKEALGETPYAYILRVRLRRAHDELLAGDKELGTTVSEVARRWGFQHSGRFAQQYHQAYRERPSDTLVR